MHVNAYVEYCRTQGNLLLTFLAVPCHRPSPETCQRTIDGHMIGTKATRKAALPDGTASDGVGAVGATDGSSLASLLFIKAAPDGSQGAPHPEIWTDRTACALRESNSRDQTIQICFCILPTKWCRKQVLRTKRQQRDEQIMASTEATAGKILGLTSSWI